MSSDVFIRSATNYENKKQVDSPAKAASDKKQKDFPTMVAEIKEIESKSVIDALDDYLAKRRSITSLHFFKQLTDDGKNWALSAKARIENAPEDKKDAIAKSVLIEMIATGFDKNGKWDPKENSRAALAEACFKKSKNASNDQSSIKFSND